MKKNSNYDEYCENLNDIKEQVTTMSFFRDAATDCSLDKPKALFLSSDEAYKLIKKYETATQKERAEIEDKLEKYACYESYKYYHGKMPEVDADILATKVAMELVRNIHKFTDSSFSRRGLVCKILRCRYVDYFKSRGRKMNKEELKEYFKNLPKDVIEEITNDKDPIIIYKLKNDYETLTDDFSYMDDELTSDDCESLEDKKYYRAYVVATIHTLFSLDRAPYKTIMYLHKSLCLTEIDTYTGGLRVRESFSSEENGNVIVENREVGALSKIEGRSLGRIRVSLPRVLESYLRMDEDEHFTDYELHLMFDPLDKKLSSYNRINNSYNTKMHYAKDKDAIEDACNIKKIMIKLRPQIEGLANKIYSETTKRTMGIVH